MALEAEIKKCSSDEQMSILVLTNTSPTHSQRFIHDTGDLVSYSEAIKGGFMG